MITIITGAVILFAAGFALGICIERMASRHITQELDQKTWERIEGWRK